MVIPTAHLAPGDLAAARDLMDASFADFTDDDWDHALGGLHALVRRDGALVGHGAVVQRRLLVRGRSLRCGYVEAVAVDPVHRRCGIGTAVMAELETLAPGYDLLALSASDAGARLYESRGWRHWRGPSSVLGPTGPQPTPDDDGAILVLARADLDLDAPIACDWRDGDVW